VREGWRDNPRDVDEAIDFIHSGDGSAWTAA
jgi:hypothetical protein